MLTVVAFAVVQDRVADWPWLIGVGATPIEAVGIGVLYDTTRLWAPAAMLKKYVARPVICCWTPAATPPSTVRLVSAKPPKSCGNARLCASPPAGTAIENDNCLATGDQDRFVIVVAARPVV